MRGAALALVLILVLGACGSEEEATTETETTKKPAERPPEDVTKPPETSDVRRTEIDRDPLSGFERQVSSGDADVRETAAGKLGDVDAAHKDRAAALLVRLLDDEVEEVRMVAAGSYARLGVENVMPLRDRMAKEEEAIVRKDLLGAIYKLAGADASADLLQVAANLDEEEHLRTFAIDALGRLKAKSAREYIEEASEDISPLIRLAAVKALGQIGAESSMEKIGERVADTDDQVRIEAARALRGMKGRKVVRYLMRGIDSDDPELLKEVVEGLKKITKQEMGYDAMKGVEENEKAIQKWRDWWVKNQKYY
jgi:HEAT repeat protein